MRKYVAVAAVLTLIASALSFGLAAKAQEVAGVNANRSVNTSISDREKAGLRGPVRSVEDEGTYPAVTASDGRFDPELKWWKKTEYDREGRISAQWSRDSSREQGLGAKFYVIRYTYTASGQLERMTREKGGDADGETVYRYDDRGRLESITNSKDPGNPIVFHYDAEGRKTKVAIAKPVEGPQGVGEQTAVSYSPEHIFDAGSGSPSLPEGGSAETVYDEDDRPTEVQTRDVGGEIVFRLQRVYDDEGHVLEEKQTMDDVLSMIPMAYRKKMMDEGEVTADELRKQVAQALGGGSEMSNTRYTYDAQGRKTLATRKSLGQMEQRIETSYNEHGDVASETWHETMQATPENANDKTTRSTERVYSYEYDAHGNWELKETSSRELPDGMLKESVEVERRRIEYY